MANTHKAGLEEVNRFSVDLVQKAGKEALKYYGKGRTRAVFDQSLVTEAESLGDSVSPDQLENLRMRLSRELEKLKQASVPPPAVLLEAAEAFVPLKVDHDLHEIFVDRYRVDGLPAILFIDGEGRLVSHLEGLISVEALLGTMDRVRSGYAAYMDRTRRLIPYLY